MAMAARSKKVAYMISKGRVHLRQGKPGEKESCVICWDDDIGSDLMFSVLGCGHRFCFNCVKQHIEVKLLDGTIPNCLHHRCMSNLSIDRCGMLLTPKLSLMWEQRIKENSRLLNNPQDDKDLKELKSMAKRKGWRQCGNCQHMIELISGCNRISCRCGYAFCYGCGKRWDSASHYNCHTRFDLFGIQVPQAPDWLLGLIVSTCSTVLYIKYSGKFQKKPRRPKSKGTEDFPNFLFGFL